ncbi:P2RX4 [Lepeophtheirus salmonis]|uniref:P2RX4 n=1 Tax=Lepeophtheirus salmonis TaxID=72036 RepID=A0A7R8H2M9_LEPSM|nr:P2RX4 [Lepeophtheirus salmonis]CAF2829154.1 P2RX4 [Lepeophtheirus salmonis]
MDDNLPNSNEANSVFVAKLFIAELARNRIEADDVRTLTNTTSRYWYNIGDTPSTMAFIEASDNITVDSQRESALHYDKWAQIKVDIKANYDGCSPIILFEKFKDRLEGKAHLLANEAASYELVVEELDRTYENIFKLAKAYLDEVKRGMPIQDLLKSSKTARKRNKNKRVQEGSDTAWNPRLILNIEDFTIWLEAYATGHKYDPEKEKVKSIIRVTKSKGGCIFHGDSHSTETLVFVFEYDTVKVVRIESKYAGILSRLVQIFIISYVIGYVLLYQKGYQKFDSVHSSINTKVKGVLVTNYSDDEFSNYVVHHHYKSLYNKIWDVNDYVIPAKENGDCPSGKNLGPKGHGILTGKCQDSICLINAWCPVENDSIFPLKNNMAILNQSRNLTVLIKNFIQFPYYKLHTTNILPNSNTSYLKSCLYNEETDPYCPIFKLDYIVNKAGYKYEDISMHGCSIVIGINWECDLDKDFMSNCRPIYSFNRLDNPYSKIDPELKLWEELDNSILFQHF